MAQNENDLKHSEEEYFHKADNLIHSPCSVLRSIFRRRWEQITGSPWTEVSSEEFISGMGKDFFKSTKPIQRKCLKSGKLEEWDMSLLWNLLKQVKWKKDDLQKKENQSIEKLVQLRNKAAHNSIKKLNEEGYKEIEQVVRVQLKELGLSPEEIEGIVEKAGVLTPVSGWTTAKKILQKGNKKFQTGHYSNAVELYSEALQVPNLLRSNQAILLEKRAAARTALAEGLKPGTEKMKCLDEAMLDIRKSLEYDNNSWKAHQILGKIYKHKNELELAVEHLNKALALSPGQGEVKVELDCCKLLLGKIERSEHLDPRAQPMTFEERLQHYNDETGRSMPKEKGSVMETLMDKLLPGQSHVQTGHRYQCGWDVNQDYLDASRHYAKADKVGNAEGTYNLAQLYLYGKGVQQWIERAIELLEKAANMPPEIYYKGIRLPNVGVRAAQHSLGLLHDQGIHVPADATEAAKWYEKAARNGLGNAANNLGLLYSEGRGVEQDMHKAVMYWKLGIQYKDMNAACSLYVFYMKQMEPKLARIMFDRSLEFGNEDLRGIQKDVYEELYQMERERGEMEPEVIAYEKKNNLSENSMTFKERILRKVSASCKEGQVLVNSLSKLDVILNSNTKWAGKAKDFNPEELKQRAKEGSITAQRLIQVFNSLVQFEDLWGSGPPFTEEVSKELVNLLFFCMTTEQHVIRFERDLGNRIAQYMEVLLRMNGHAKSELDMRLRICYVYGHDDDMRGIFEILKVGLDRYPEEVIFYDALSGVYGVMENPKMGLKVVANGLTRFPDHVELLFHKAVFTRLLQDGINFDIKTDNLEMRRAYEKFLEKAPKDHRKVPEAYYAVAISYMVARDEDNTLLYYEKGEEAEKMQLTGYLPYYSSLKNLLELEGVVNFTKLKRGLQLQVPETSKASLFKQKNEKSSTSTSSSAVPAPQRRTKLHLENEWRLRRIKHHRNMLHDLKTKVAQFRRNPDLLGVSMTQAPRLKHKLPRSLTDLKSIKLIEIDATKDHIYEGRILNLTIIDDPVIEFLPSVQNIAEDENGDVTRIHVYNVSQNATTGKKLGFGSRLAVIHPYLRIGCNDQIPFIRVDDPRCIIYNEAGVNMCRYCGEKNAPHTCGKCKWAKYCSKECQEKDWKIFKHKLICIP